MIEQLLHRREAPPAPPGGGAGAAPIIRHRPRRRAWGRLLAAAAAVLALGQLLAVAYHQGGRAGEAALQTRLLGELELGAATLRELRGESQAHLDALAARVALLQARLARLDALGSELVATAQLEQGAREFDFTADPGLGGRAPARRQATDAQQLETTLAGLLHQAEDRELQLRILQDVVRHRQLVVEAYPSGWPVRSGWISSRFGWRKDPFHGGRAFHHGLDFAARHKVLVRAAARGIVEFVGRQGNYGLTVELNHGNGYRSRYAHAHELLVKPGQVVERGEPVARVGSTGRSTGPHLHFEVLENGTAVDPLKFLSARR